MPKTQDVVDLLTEQHAHIRDLFTKVGQARSAATRQEAFEELRRFLAVHETAEALVSHPAARMAGDDGGIVDARMAEEDHAKQMLADLDSLDVEDPSFGERLAELKDAVYAHADLEEREEFPILRAETDPQRLERLAEAVRAVERIAPTRPHPAAGSSMTINLMVGPLASVLDRTRDAIEKALRD